MRYQPQYQTEDSVNTNLCNFASNDSIRTRSFISDEMRSTPESLTDNGNQTASSSGYESPECQSNIGSTPIQMEDNHNVVLTEENLSRVSNLYNMVVKVVSNKEDEANQ